METDSLTIRSVETIQGLNTMRAICIGPSLCSICIRRTHCELLSAISFKVKRISYTIPSQWDDDDIIQLAYFINEGKLME